LVELNFQTVRTSPAENEELIAKATMANEPQAVLALPATQLPVAAEKVQAYWRHFYKIVSGTHASSSQLPKLGSNSLSMTPRR
jgi:phasin family protein